ncbi:choice-of-anchor I domain-containing protein [Porticoccus sp. GXU_MW_L64]
MNRFAFAFLCAAVSPLAFAAQLQWLGSYDTGYKKGAEIISVQQSSGRAALTVSGKNQVDILSLSNPAQPERRLRITVEGQDIDDISSVAFHPTDDYVAVAAIAKNPLASGKVFFYSASNGELLNSVASGYWPDSVLFSSDGRWLGVANEGEPFVVAGNGELVTPPGSITLVDMQKGLNNPVIHQIALPDLSGVDGVLQGSDKRSFERDIDLNGDGHIDGDEEEQELPISAATPDYLEPEYLAFTPDGTTLFVALQENNAVVVVDTASAQVARSFGLGVTQHLADTQDDGRVAFVNELTAFREPDGIALGNGGKWLLTADEGDTEPKASKIKAGQKAGGGRTLSIFDAASGELLGDTGNQLDAMAHALGIYPDGRSDNKGSEPETVVYLELDGTHYAVVTLERADALALVNISNPQKPLVESVVPLRTAGDKAKAYGPEGLALYQANGKYYLFCANEKRGTLSVVTIR